MDIDLESQKAKSAIDNGNQKRDSRESIAAGLGLGPGPKTGSIRGRTSPTSPSSQSTRRHSTTSVSGRPAGTVPGKTDSDSGSTHARVSPTRQSIRSRRRHSPRAVSPGRKVPAPGVPGAQDRYSESRRSRTSPTRQSVHSSRRRSPSPGSSANGSNAPGIANSEDSSDFDDEEIGLFDFAEELRLEKPPGEPWFMEMTRLRRLHFLWLNKELASIRKKILENKRASKEDMEKLQNLLRDQASAIRDFQYIKSLDFLSSGQMEQRRASSMSYFPHTAKSVDDRVLPFETENYRCLPRAPQTALEPFTDEVREFFRTFLPSKVTWTKAEIDAKPDWFKHPYKPKTLSPTVDRLARFTIAMAGALFILVPMYVMAIGRSRNKNLITTTVAVVLFALLCSVTLRTSNDQTLAATAGYAAVLMVFVGLASAPNEAGSS